MKTLRHPDSIPTPEKPELKSRNPPKNQGFEEPGLTRGESKLWAKSHWAVPICHPHSLLKGAACTWRPTWGESELSYSNILLKAGEVEVAKHCGTEKRPLLRLCIFTSHHAQLVRHDRPCTNIAINNFSIIICIIISIIIAHFSHHRKHKHIDQSISCTKSSRNPTQVKKVSSSHQTTRGWLTFWFKPLKGQLKPPIHITCGWLADRRLIHFAVFNNLVFKSL